MKKLLMGIMVLSLAVAANATLIVTGSGTTTYNFNTYAGTAAPADWTVTGVTAFNGVGTGSGTAGGVWAYQDGAGSAGNSLGALGSGTFTLFTYGLTIQNNTGFAITEMSLGFDVLQYRVANGGRLSTFALDDVNVLGFSETVFTGSNVPATGAQQPPLTVGSAYSQSLTGLNIANGSSVTLNWIYDRGTGTGSAQGLALDNVSIGVTTAPIPEPATMSLLGLGALAMVLRRKIRK
jgi:hypothetical protein